MKQDQSQVRRDLTTAATPRQSKVPTEKAWIEVALPAAFVAAVDKAAGRKGRDTFVREAIKEKVARTLRSGKGKVTK
ncbi:MAG TPA: hypothetical protein VK530_19285 [Candidatus Acidoferrum sp.]|nr:hypothetical protein [Candidatus Acidoferrum sp.]